jgi:hypothetical protein
MPAIPKLVTNLLLLVQFKMKSRFYKSWRNWLPSLSSVKKYVPIKINWRYLAGWYISCDKLNQTSISFL